MSLRINTTGYITWVGEKISISEKNYLVNFTLKTEREQYGKYDDRYNSEVKYDTIKCVAFSKKADYIIKNYKQIKDKTKNENVKVEIYGHLEAEQSHTQLMKSKFFVMDENEKLIDIDLTVDDDIYYKTTFTRITAHEITFIDTERTKESSHAATVTRTVTCSRPGNKSGNSSKNSNVDIDKEYDNLYKELEETN